MRTNHHPPPVLPIINYAAAFLGVLIAGVGCTAGGGDAEGREREKPEQPRIVNIYNFIRNTDFRLQDSEELMFDCTRRQIELLKEVKLPATWALQYDALINPHYPKLLKEQLGPNDEIAMWWEIPRQLAEKAGLKWRGKHDWDPEAHVGFSPGYTPDERRKLVDVYMADFKEIFGFYPKTVGSWFIDEVTLEYLVEKYGLIASCNCKDQIGTDFYTLWGGYWNQAYYPSRVNAYMPAQTRQGQINIPIFRMLGSDPIYEHGKTPGLISLEPVYRPGGGTPQWVDWFMKSLMEQPSLAFAYTQAGQENSFTWAPVKEGLTHQFRMFAELVKTGKIRVETLEQSGKWFRERFPLTPATSMIALDDWKNEGRKTVWYNSRFYRLNVLWEKDSFFLRDIHCFDEKLVASTHEKPLTETTLAYETLPIVDWAQWSNEGRRKAGMFPVLIATDGTTMPLPIAGDPVVTELNATDLSIVQPLRGGGALSIVCTEQAINFLGRDAQRKPLNWGWQLVGNERLAAAVENVSETKIAYHYAGVGYQLAFGSRAGSSRKLEDGSIQLMANQSGQMTFDFSPSGVGAAVRTKIVSAPGN